MMNKILSLDQWFVSAGYKDTWTVERKWTEDSKLKANIVMERKEVLVNNQAVEDFLQEMIKMKQFNHPNVLSLIGVSVHNDKPCIILPLMTNGDLHRYLKKHFEVSTILKSSKICLGM